MQIALLWSLHSAFPSLQDKITAFQKFATMYINYVLIFRKLEECYDQVVHPQKRRLIRHILDGTMGRWVHCEGVVGVKRRWVHSRAHDDVKNVVIMRSWCTVRGVSGRMVHCEGEVDAG